MIQENIDDLALREALYNRLYPNAIYYNTSDEALEAIKTDIELDDLSLHTENNNQNNDVILTYIV